MASSVARHARASRPLAKDTAGVAIANVERESVVEFAEYLASVEFQRRKSRLVWIGVAIYCTLTCISFILLSKTAYNEVSHSFVVTGLETRLFRPSSWMFSFMEVHDDVGSLQTFVFLESLPKQVLKNFTIQQDFELRPGLFKTWTRFMQQGSRIEFNISSLNQELPLVVCAMPESQLLSWAHDADWSSCPSVFEQLLLTQAGESNQFEFRAIETTDYVLAVGLLGDNQRQVGDDNNDDAEQISIAMKLNLLLFDVELAHDYFGGSFVKDLLLWDAISQRDGFFIFANPSTGQNLHVIVKLSPRVFPLIVVAVLAQFISISSLVFASRLLLRKWRSQLRVVASPMSVTTDVDSTLPKEIRKRRQV